MTEITTQFFKTLVQPLFGRYNPVTQTRINSLSEVANRHQQHVLVVRRVSPLLCTFWWFSVRSACRYTLVMDHKT